MVVWVIVTRPYDKDTLQPGCCLLENIGGAFGGGVSCSVFSGES